MKVEIGSFPTDFKVAVRHASAVRKVTDNVICKLTDSEGNVGLGEGCPRSYVTGETAQSARAFLGTHAQPLGDIVEATGLDGLRGWMAEHNDIIDQNPAAFCAIELALLDVLARGAHQPIEDILGVDRLVGTFHYTAVLGDNPRLLYEILLHRYLRRGFRDFKLKLSGDLARDQAKVRRLKRQGEAVRVRVDANNLWSDPSTCIDHIRRMDITFVGIEEPLKANDIDGFQEISAALATPVILDESGLRPEQIDRLPGAASRWILNCRVSKMGGLQRSLASVAAAKRRGIGVIVGAQVGETSILSRAALTVASAADDALVGQEGAFGTNLLRSDFTTPIVMFNRTGVVAVGHEVSASAPGLGLTAAVPLSP